MDENRSNKTTIVKGSEKGFSLIELVVVVAVLAVLSAIAIPSFFGIIKSAKIANAKTNLIYIIQECIVYSTLNGVTQPTFSDINLGKTTNTYGDSYGIVFAGDDDGFTYDTSISSQQPIRDNSSCMRVAAKSTTKDGAGNIFLLPHFEVYNNFTTGQIEKNCIVGNGAYNSPKHCNTSAPAGSQW